MGEVKAISEGGLELANHRETAPVLSLLANHGESAEPRPGASRAGALRLSCSRCGLLQSQLRPEAPPTTPPLLCRGTRGERAGWRCSPSGAPLLLGFVEAFSVAAEALGKPETSTIRLWVSRDLAVLRCPAPTGAVRLARDGRGRFGLVLPGLRPLRSAVPLGSPRLQTPLLRTGWRSRYFSHSPGSQTSEATSMGPDSSIPKAREVLECGSPHSEFC